MDYYHKYLKYKLKYLSLKKQIGGAGLPTNYFETFFKISNEDTKVLFPSFNHRLYVDTCSTNLILNFLVVEPI